MKSISILLGIILLLSSLTPKSRINELIKKLNGGVVDTRFPVNWQHYRNCILLTQHNEIKQLNTKIYQIIELQFGYLKKGYYIKRCKQ